MLSQIKQAWKLKDVRRKILYTLMMIVVFRIGATIPVPGVNTNIIKGMVDSNGLLSHIICLLEEHSVSLHYLL